MTLTSEAGAPQATAMLKLDTAAATKPVSSTLFGLFLEDINFAGDGGLNANLVNNFSFEGVYVDRGETPFISAPLAAFLGPEKAAEMIVMTPKGRVIDRTRHWITNGATLEALSEEPIAPNTHFGRITSDGETVLENRGYPGAVRDMALRVAVEFGAWVRADRFEGNLEVRLIDAEGRVVAAETLELPTGGWQHIATRLAPTQPTRGALQLVLRGRGTLDLDAITLIPEDHWGADDPRWSQGRFRRDLVQALKDLHPKFLRFPGGCVVEGCGDDSQYKWKNTVGPIEGRLPEYNVWGQFVENGDYSQSHQIGFYEYFLLCEDLGMEPMPIAWAGIACNGRADFCLPLDGDEFEAIVQDTVDLIDWATGDPATSSWAKLRADAGHPEPFALNMIGIGNENGGAQYLERFAPIKDAVEARRPGLTIVMSTGGPEGPEFDEIWSYAREHGQRYVVDEHFYRQPQWFLNETKRYDDYPRGTARAFLGEWAAYPPTMLGTSGEREIFDFSGDGSGLGGEVNTWESAVSEAAFLTGVERNSDVIAMSSYAPLFNLVEHGQWAHNLINFNPTDVAPTVNYLVQRLFATQLGDRIVPVDGELPDLVFASATADDTTGFVKLVNAGTEPTEVVIRIEGASGGPVTGTLLRGPLDAVNRLAYDGAPQPEVLPEETSHSVTDSELRIVLAPASVQVVRVPVTTSR